MKSNFELVMDDDLVAFETEIRKSITKGYQLYGKRWTIKEQLVASVLRDVGQISKSSTTKPKVVYVQAMIKP